MLHNLQQICHFSQARYGSKIQEIETVIAINHVKFFYVHCNGIKTRIIAERTSWQVGVSVWYYTVSIATLRTSILITTTSDNRTYTVSIVALRTSILITTISDNLHCLFQAQWEQRQLYVQTSCCLPMS